MYLKMYGERDGTARTHAGETQVAGGWRDFAEARDELSGWLDARASAKLATAFQVVFDTTSELVDADTGEAPGTAVESFEAMVPRHEPAAAIAALFELTPPLDSDADEEWRGPCSWGGSAPSARSLARWPVAPRRGPARKRIVATSGSDDQGGDDPAHPRTPCRAACAPEPRRLPGNPPLNERQGLLASWSAGPPANLS
ncbi:hypothetical protein SLA_7080 [Streptomyces laurentii]|uniref:Uncharacterized protein n=1 Tax=Streptomyces laurentii TaxID=39478 RepID=A0A160P929_STRLU|nr:hypothetical protein SLA_7080 [Streptomyces laurentii]